MDNLDRVIVWGTGNVYEKVAPILNNINIDIVMFLSNDINYNSLCSPIWFDGKRVHNPKILEDNLEYDYLIIASKAFDDIICQIKSFHNYKTIHSKIIDAKIFLNPCFDWAIYKNIRVNTPSIVCEACYGGYIYNQLGLEFKSPFINTRIQENEYLRLINNLPVYLDKSLEIYSDISISDTIISDKDIGWGKAGYPIFSLGDIKLHAIHANNSTEYINEWNRRRQRLDTDNAIVMMIIENEDILYKFDKVKAKHKIGFYYKETDCKNVVCFKEWSNYKERIKYGHDFISYVHHQIWDENIVRKINLFKLMNYSKDFLRM